MALITGADRVLGEGQAAEGVDVALELSDAAAGVRACLSGLAVGGTAVLAGSVAPGPAVELDPEWLVRGWRTVTGVHNYEPRHLRQAVDFLAEHGGGLPWGQILGGPIGLSHLPKEFAEPSRGLRTAVKIVG